MRLVVTGSEQCHTLGILLSLMSKGDCLPQTVESETLFSRLWSEQSFWLFVLIQTRVSFVSPNFRRYIQEMCLIVQRVV